MSERPCLCGAVVEVPAAHHWGTWVQCGECNAFVTTMPGHSPPVFELTSSGAPPGWAPTLPVDPSSRIHFIESAFSKHQAAVRSFLTVCRACRAWLPIDGTVKPRFVRCGGCGARRSLDGEPLEAHQVFVLFRDSGALYAEFPSRGVIEERISMPTRPAPTRAWIEREDRRGVCTVNPLLEKEVTLASLGLDPRARVLLDGGWFLVDEGARIPLASGASLLRGWSARSGVWFGQSGACEPKEHYEQLDERPDESDAWQVWADHLEERDEGAAASWIHAKARTDIALADQLGYLAPLVRRQLATVKWNAFGYVEQLVIGVELLRLHPFALDARSVPAIRYLQSLNLEIQEPAALTRLASVWSGMALPRSLRRIEMSGPKGDVSSVDALLAHARTRCPWFGR